MYQFCKEILDDIIEILTEENRFKNITKSMPDMITCDFHNSYIFPKSVEHPDTPTIQCCFTVYFDKTVFSIVYFPFDDCQNIVSRLNSELPDLCKKIDLKSNILTIPIIYNVIDNLGMCILQRTKDRDLRKKMLKFQIDYFFRYKADRLIHKIFEIMLKVII